MSEVTNLFLNYKKMVYLGYASMDKDKRFSFHDLKAKGVSDHELNESGHKCRGTHE